MIDALRAAAAAAVPSGISVGVDVVSVERVRVALGRTPSLVANILSSDEMVSAPAGRLAEFVAGRWAAKEAICKALGVGLCQLRPNAITITSDAAGPGLTVGFAVDVPAHLSGVHVSVSITHDAGIAAAVAAVVADAAAG